MEHSIDVTFHRLYQIIFYEVVEPGNGPFPTSDEVYIHQRRMGSIYYTTDKRVEKKLLLQKFDVGIGKLGAQLITDPRGIGQERKEALGQTILKWWGDDFQKISSMSVRHVSIASVPSDWPETKRYKLYSEQMSRGFAYALGSSGLARKYAGGPSVGDTKPVPAPEQNFMDEEPRNFQPVMRLDQ